MAHAKRIQVGLGKENRWASRPTPGSHKWKSSIAVVTALRDVLGLVGNAKEAKKVMVDGLLLVDGVVEKNHKRGLGLMDVIELPRLKKSYRVVPTKKGLEIIEIDSKDSKVKLCRVVGKRTVSGGRTQLSFHDGTTVLDEKKEFKVNDTAVLSLPDRKVKKQIGRASCRERV